MYRELISALASMSTRANLQRVCDGISLDFDESKHPRGNPKNAGQFVKRGTGCAIGKSEKSLRMSPKEQYESVVRRYKGTKEWMKAPNGKRTKLTERQWVQVRTSAFKKWFGDWENDPAHSSKMVDENGEPQVFYHGTRDKFDRFIPGYYTKLPCVFFADEKRRDELAGDYAQENGKVLSFFLNIRRLAKSTPEEKDFVSAKKFDGFETRYDEEFEQKFYNYRTNKISRVFHRIGDRIEVGVFSPENIKSATDNDGSFSPATSKFRR